MAREIKFKAWDKSKKKMIYDIQNEFNGRIEVGMNSFQDYLNDNFEVMQYVGVKDNLGYSIYEGDYISYYDTEQDDETGEIIFRPVEDEVHYNNGIFYVGSIPIEYVGIKNAKELSEILDVTVEELDDNDKRYIGIEIIDNFYEY